MSEITEEQRQEALRTAPLRRALAETEDARKQAQQAAARFESIEESKQRQLPLTPEQTLGRRAEQVKSVKVKPEKLERKQATGQVAGIREFFTPKRQKGGRTLRDAIRDRYRPRSMPAHVRTSRGSQVIARGKVLESSGRISTELNPQKAERLAILRERVRAVQNRRELHGLEKLYRRFRAQNTHDPELRP